MSVNANVRNVLIVLGIAALVVLLPGGGKGANVAIQAASLLFLGTIGWFAAIQYRQHKVALFSLGDARRAGLYAALAVAFLTITATHRLFQTSAGTIAWIALVGAAGYTVFAVVWAARKY